MSHGVCGGNEGGDSVIQTVLGGGSSIERGCLAVLL